MSKDLVIAKLDKARVALYEASTIQEAKRFVDLGATAETWARQQKLGGEIVDYAHSFRIEALRRLGEMLQESERADGGDAQRTRFQKGTESPPTLADLGLDKKTSSIAQRLAALPAEQFEQVRTGVASVMKAMREVEHAKRPNVVVPLGKYRVIYADPPWKYGDTRAIDGWESTAAEHHYPTMSIDSLCALPILTLADDNAVLFLWVTSPLLFECVPVVAAWGFKYKASFVWDKVRHNVGHYNSVRHEFLLVCTRGSCTPDVKELYDSVQTIERTGKHSEKPEEFRQIIDKLYPYGDRIELFARKPGPGNWKTWGNEP